jgi:pimeloyl-ACP methyl ester carboxylesterase
MPLPAGMPGVDLMVAFYLHGFASGPQSTKAAYFSDRLAEHGIPLRCPDFNEPDITSLTVTRMIDQLAADLAKAEDEVTLIGSSLGGTLAILAAARALPGIDRVILLAPAVMFAKPGHHLLPPERIEEWRTRGALPFFHYAYEEERLLGYGFYDDSLRHHAFDAAMPQPTLIFQGMRDASVDHRTVEAFARTRPNVTLSLLDDDHQLIASLPRIWDGVSEFMGLHE